LQARAGRDQRPPAPVRKPGPYVGNVVPLTEPVSPQLLRHRATAAATGPWPAIEDSPNRPPTRRSTPSAGCCATHHRRGAHAAGLAPLHGGQAGQEQHHVLNEAARTAGTAPRPPPQAGPRPLGGGEETTAVRHFRAAIHRAPQSGLAPWSSSRLMRSRCTGLGRVSRSGRSRSISVLIERRCGGASVLMIRSGLGFDRGGGIGRSGAGWFG